MDADKTPGIRGEGLIVMELFVIAACLRAELKKYARRLIALAKRFVAKYITKKPFLMHVEYHVVDHCNLNCKGCSHFSNVSPESFRKVEDFEREIACLASKVDLHELLILGGEPLLHSDLTSFLSVARKYYSKSRINLCTNGLLLSKMNDGFWDSMRENKIGIKLTIYPPVKKKSGDLIKLIRQQRVKLAHVFVADYFNVSRNRNGDSDPVEVHTHCPRRICHHLRDGRLYTCPDACYMDYFNSYFHQEIPKDPGIDIHENSGKDLERYVTTYKDMCRYCTAKLRFFKWVQSKKAVNEWDLKI